MSKNHKKYYYLFRISWMKRKKMLMFHLIIIIWKYYILLFASCSLSGREKVQTIHAFASVRQEVKIKSNKPWLMLATTSIILYQFNTFLNVRCGGPLRPLDLPDRIYYYFPRKLVVKCNEPCKKLAMYKSRQRSYMLVSSQLKQPQIYVPKNYLPRDFRCFWR